LLSTLKAYISAQFIIIIITIVVVVPVVVVVVVVVIIINNNLFCITVFIKFLQPEVKV